MKIPILVRCSFIHIPNLMIVLFLNNKNVDSYLEQSVNTNLITLAIVCKCTLWLIILEREN